MLTPYLPSAASLASHWTIVVAVGALFFLVQLALSLRLYARARRHERTLLALQHDLAVGGDGRGDSADSFPWLDWVRTAFPLSESPPRFTRDQALHELDARLTSDPAYLMLQRMGVMAPLLGVVLTVVGFFWLEVDADGEQSLQSILAAVTPLVSGVGAGAVLALFNQALLQAVGSDLERLRTTARTWFDAAVWPHAGRGASEAADGAVAALHSLAQSLAGAGDLHTAGARRIEASSSAIESAARDLQAVVRQFQGEMKGIPQALAVLRDATAASAQALQELIPVGARAVSNLDVSVAAFRSTIDREFTDAAKLQYRASQALAVTVDNVHDSAAALKSGVEEQTGAAAAHAVAVQARDEALHRQVAASIGQVTDSLHGLLTGGAQLMSQAEATHRSLAVAADGLAGAGDRLRHAIDDDVTPAQHTLHAAAQSFGSSAAELSQFITAGLRPAAADLAALHDTFARLSDAVAAIGRFSAARGDVDRLTDSLSRAAEVADAIAALPEQLRTVVEGAAVDAAERSASRRVKSWLGGRPR